MVQQQYVITKFPYQQKFQLKEQYKYGNGKYSEYEEWAGKLQDVYMSEAEKIQDVYLESAM